MAETILSPAQASVADWLHEPHLFVQGPAGSGKTSAAQARLNALLMSGVPGEQILVLVPQRTLSLPYQQISRLPDLPPGSQVSCVTMGGIAQRMTSLFWPMVARQAGFTSPDRPPTFLTLETAQYFLARIVKPLLEEGYFESLTIDRNRLYSQIIDNLNKAASVGFSPATISERLKSAWSGKPGQDIIYEQAQDCALRFRAYCLENNLLDFSLQLELFTNHIWPSFLGRAYLSQNYRHLIYDNIEEDIPVAHDIIRAWLPSFDTSLLLYDEEAGYRAFLGADPASAMLLQAENTRVLTLDETFTTSPTLQTLEVALTSTLTGKPHSADPTVTEAFSLSSHRFHPELADWVCGQIINLVENGKPPGQIAVLAPFLSDSLRFSLMNRLQSAGIPIRSHRPSRSLRDEPTTQALLSYASLAYPHWNLPCTRAQLRAALTQSIEGLDLVRADLISQILFSPAQNNRLKGFDDIKPDTQNRITYRFGEQYEVIRRWLEEFQAQPPQELDVFISRIFGELLSQPGFGFHQNYEAAAITARLIESIQKFRRVTGPTLQAEKRDVGQEYIQMVQEGVLAAQYLNDWDAQSVDAVYLAPAYTFLMSNQPVDIQFWLDIGSQGWWERLYQPLTHPVVLSRRWSSERKWTDADENQINQQTLSHLVSGLLYRCREHVYLCASGIDERGNRQRGPLIRSIQTILLNLTAPTE